MRKGTEERRFVPHRATCSYSRLPYTLLIRRRSRWARPITIRRSSSGLAKVARRCVPRWPAAGLRTALIERAHVAGTCINEGCTPTKTMVASARVAYLARRGGDYGVRTGRIEIDMQRVRARKRDIVERFRTATQARLERTANLDLICGEASFTDPKALRVRLTSAAVSVQ